jgi:hypothetical protein
MLGGTLATSQSQFPWLSIYRQARGADEAIFRRAIMQIPAKTQNGDLYTRRSAALRRLSVSWQLVFNGRQAGTYKLSSFRGIPK